MLPPLLVTMLTTPPEKRPYSAEMPDVSTCVSSIASSMNRLFGGAEEVVVDVDAVDQEHVVVGEPPAIVTWPAFGVLSVRPGASSAIVNGVRPVGSSLISFEL